MTIPRKSRPFGPRPLILIAAVACLLLAIAASTTAAGPTAPKPGISVAELFPSARFDPAIPTQAQMLGVEPGARPLRHGELLRYLERLAELSPRADIVTYSETYEDRPLIVFRVSDESTMARIDAFREEHAKRMDPRGRSAAEDQALLREVKAVAWMAYGIHGDELSSSDAAAALAYWLVAGEDERARKLRSELVILIDPCENPDGRERFLAQTASFAHAVPSPDMEDLSHTTVWPWGRGNHYLFDLNRDWFSMVQPESRRSEVIAGWNPQLMVDSHEMGADDTYLFSPPRHPFNPHLPTLDQRWGARFAADQARALDERGYSYYTREWNEEFFPGYGSSWASYSGAIGILYEMSGTEGTLVRQPAGTLRTYAQAVEHQVTSSVANLDTLAAGRESMLRDYVTARRETIARGTAGPVGAWVLSRRRHPDRVDALVDLLRRQGIEVLRSEGSPRVSGLRDARNAEPATDIGDAAWMVPLDQPAGALVRVLLDPHVPMEATFFREEREYLERGWGTRLYDTTAWSLPLLYDIDAYWSATRPSSGWSAAATERPSGRFEAAADAVAFVMHGESDRSVSALADMLQQGLSVRVADREFRFADREYARGAIVIKREGNPDDLDRRLAAIVARWNVEVQALRTGLAQQGPDLGGRHFLPLVAPRVGIWTGVPVAPAAYGALWHLLDRSLQLRFSGLDLLRFNQTDLSRYNVLIFPQAFGGAGAYRELLGEDGLARLKGWIEAGGSAIGIGDGAEFLADDKSELTQTRLRRQALEKYPPVVLGPSADLVAAAGNLRAVGLRVAEEEKSGDEVKPSKSKSKPKAQPIPRASAFDVAPLLGAGARPFAVGHEQGTPVPLEPETLAQWIAPLLPQGATKPEKEDLERADERLRRFGARGTLLRLELDPEMWLTWGVGRELPALVGARDTLVAEAPVQVAARFAEPERLHLGGLLWPETAGRMARTAYLTREASGRGQVILVLNDPEFRGWTLGTRRLLTNAILYGPGLGTHWSTPW